MDPPTKICRVCGDVAVSFNFDGLSCTSCKMFFKRNAFEKFTCYYSGNCPININSRKSCQYCRLNKCTAIGMKKELVKGNANLTAITENIKEETSNEFERFIQQAGPSRQSAEQIEENTEREVQDAVELELENEQIEELAQEEEEPEINQSALLPYESQCIELVKRATELFSEKLPFRIEPTIIGYAKDFTQAFNAQQFQVHKLLSFVNAVPGFEILSSSDKLTLFKYSFKEMMVLNSSFLFKFERNAYLIPLTDRWNGTAVYLNLDMLIEPGEERKIQLLRDVIFRVRQEISNDTFIRDLVSVLFIFKPRLNMPCTEYVRYRYHFYRYLLRKNLLHKYGNNSAKANEKYQKLRQIIRDIRYIAQTPCPIVRRSIESTQSSGVLVEIYGD